MSKFFRGVCGGFGGVGGWGDDPNIVCTYE
jgi:hypothetical protein